MCLERLSLGGGDGKLLADPFARFLLTVKTNPASNGIVDC